MRKHLILRAFILGGLLALAMLRVRAEETNAISARIRSAAPGTTVTLPAGTYRLANVRIPDGVSLRGTGFANTIIDASTGEGGLVLGGKLPAHVSDLSVTGAAQYGLLLDGAAGKTVERVLVRHCGCGLIARDCSDCSFRNLVLGGNSAGASLTSCKRSSLVNCTIDGSQDRAVRIASCGNLAVFNNLITDTAHGIAISGVNRSLSIDHNIYVASNIGYLEGAGCERQKVEAWATLSGYDTHSLTIAVAYANAAAGDYRPMSRLAWEPDRSTASGIGVPSLAGVSAPTTDIDGTVRREQTDLGAYQTAFVPPRAADGTLTVHSGEGVTSAGLYAPDGRLVAYLFQNLPLTKGQYPYWLPARNWQGQPIPAANYTLKTAESHLGLDYIAAAGNGDLASSKTDWGSVAKRASLDPKVLAFDNSGRLAVAQSGFESGQWVRTYDAPMEHFAWSIPGGGDTTGMTADRTGNLLVINQPAALFRLKSANGDYVPFHDGSVKKELSSAVKQPAGMTWLGGKLYIADAKSGSLVICGGGDLDVAGTVAVAGVSQPAADAAAGIIWAISSGDIIGLNPAGAIKYRRKLVEQPALLAAASGRLAVYSAALRKVHIFDMRDPDHPRLLWAIGDGSDGYGKIRADRFWNPRAIAIDASGQVAVADPPRVCLFGPNGTVKRMAMGMWGQQISYGWFADDRVHFFNVGGGYDIVLDEVQRTWQPGTRWRPTMPDCDPVFFFSSGGKDFGVFSRKNKMLVALMRPDGVAQMLVQYGYDHDGLSMQRASGDGVIKDSDPAAPVIGPDGKRITFSIFDNLGNTDTRKDGSLALETGDGLFHVPMTGLDASGLPRYDFAHAKRITAHIDGSPQYRLPYDFSKAEKLAFISSRGGDLYVLPDGGYVAQVFAGDGPTGGECGTGHSVARFDGNGRLLWYDPLTPAGLNKGLNGITHVGGVTVAARAELCEFECIDRDGLGLGALGTPKAMGWLGMWLDNQRQTQGFFGRDGKPYLVVGDYCEQSYHWMELTGTDTVKRTSTPVTISAGLAASLASQPGAAAAAYATPAVPRVRIKCLAAALPIDGNPVKWRSLGIQPIVMSAGDPQRNSAIVRLGYCDDALYLQVIKFARIFTFHHKDFHQHYLQDGIEFNIGTFWSGWKYNVTRLGNKDDIILRDRFLGGDTLLTREQAPRTITLLDSAVNVPERKLLEASSGIDMRGAKVMIIEVKLGKAALEGLPTDRALSFARGKSFIFGLAVNHNDVPGSDQIDSLYWPTLYGAFSRDGDLATAVFE